MTMMLDESCLIVGKLVKEGAVEQYIPYETWGRPRFATRTILLFSTVVGVIDASPRGPHGYGMPHGLEDASATWNIPKSSIMTQANVYAVACANLVPVMSRSVRQAAFNASMYFGERDEWQKATEARRDTDLVHVSALAKGFIWGKITEASMNGIPQGTQNGIDLLNKVILDENGKAEVITCSPETAKTLMSSVGLSAFGALAAQNWLDDEMNRLYSLG